MRVTTNKRTIQKCQQTHECNKTGMFLVDNIVNCGKHAHQITIDFTKQEVIVV